MGNSDPTPRRFNQLRKHPCIAEMATFQEDFVDLFIGWTFLAARLVMTNDKHGFASMHSSV